MKVFLFALAASLALLTACNPTCSSGQVEVAMISGSHRAPLCVEVADTLELQEIGLMNRTSLPENSGMLFAFPSATVPSFWMRDTRIPLSMIFIDDNKTVVDILQAVPCPDSEKDCPFYVPSKPVRYVLEASPSFPDKNNISNGSILEYDG